MKRNKTIKIISLLMLFMLLGFKSKVETTTYKCMIQMTNYSGEGAYVIISLLNPEGEYDKTLYVQGDDDEWYSEITAWWKFHGKRRADIDAITGATISGGGRMISVIEIENSKIDTGYKIRFETVVENQEYYKDDVEFELTSETIKNKIKGKGFIRYVRMMAQ
ncbi:DUF2271 domain-containing protein [Flavivirga abyssicola]|uniref:DUF2271 domain-containing protein n=1 Tax=Flavivirga abyssicola TaxID=3063533 RepID=UPI0026E04F9D|nr:DUF2271 domain-containing protein [Flavivirga sp. MEBiC07777]WVK15059.1 DUF2271 domain-containing protein [Flavivirga sp. MEBiC07777]